MVVKRKTQSPAAGSAAKQSKVVTSGCNVEYMVNQKVYANFKGMRPEEIDSLQNSAGQTLRTKLTADVEADRARAGSITWGSTYYDGLRLIYARAKPLWEELRAVRPLDDLQ